MLPYCASVSSVVSDFHKQTKLTLPQPTDRKLHDLKPGDWIVVKNLRKKHWKSHRCTGPFQILLTTETAVKITEKAT